MGNFISALASAAGRSNQRSNIATGCPSDRKVGIAPRGQRTAPNGRRGRTRTVDRFGTLDKIRDGSIKIYGDLDRLLPDSVVFTDAAVEKFDAITLATGFRPDLRQLIPDVEGVFDEHGMPPVTGQATNAPGLYFCGQITSPTGQLREIGLEAGRIAEIAKRYIAAL